MSNRQRANLSKFAMATIVGLVIGAILGYMADKFDWGFGYPAAIGMVLCCVYSVEIFDSLNTAYLFPRFEKYSRGKKLTLQMSSSMIVHILGWLLLVWIAGMILGFSLFRWEVLMWLAIFIAIVSVGHSMHHLFNFYRELKQKDALEEKLKSLAAHAELKALKAQINPHFLFNSLNTIASLINIAPAKAEEAVEKLADVFRYILSSSNREFVTLQNEIDFLDSYLDIEKARFGDRLEVKKSVQPEVLSTRIPSLILQPLVENCLKHGITKEGKVKIDIKCFFNGNTVNIEVLDQGQGVPEEIKRGLYTQSTGLRNVSERLLRVYGEGYGFKIKDNNPYGTIAVVTIPREKELC